MSTLSTKSIVCFSSNDWSDIPSSKFHIMRHLGRRHKILYIDTLGIRHPQISTRDFKRAIGKVRKSFSGLRNVESNIYAWSPLAIPYHGFPIVNWFNSYSVAKSVKGLMSKLDMPESIIWAYLPNAVNIIERLPPLPTLYHCIDDYAEFTDVPRAPFERMEQRLLKLADMTVVSAKNLYEKKRSHAKRITYVPHGVDAPEFREHLTESLELEDLNRIKHPIAGFVGRLADWIDLPLMARTAKELPDWNFVFVGPSNVSLDTYRSIPNMHFVGKKEYKIVPHYIQRFDVCLMPFVKNDLVASVNPLKMYEYLAIGRPVVTVPMDEVADFAHVLTIAAPSDFSKAIRLAYETDTEAKRRERIESVADRSWGAIAERILGLLDQS